MKEKKNKKKNDKKRVKLSRQVGMAEASAEV